MDTSIFKVPFPEAGDHTRLWEHFQALAEQIERMAKGQFAEESGPTVTNLTTVTPVNLCSVEVYGRAGIPIRAVTHVWAQTTSTQAVRFGVAFSGGGLSVQANATPSLFSSILVGGGTTVYATTQREVVAVPTVDGLVTVTAQAWLSAAGTGNANYPRLSVETRAWPQ